jgi:hypothetical protein
MLAKQTAQEEEQNAKSCEMKEGTCYFETPVQYKYFNIPM